MKHKRKQAAVLFLALCLLTGCGKVQPDKGTSISSSKTAEPGSVSSSDTEKSNEEFLAQEEEPTPTPILKNASMSSKEHYSDSKRYISVLGLKEYKKLKGEFGTDKPGKGNRFLVLFLEIENSGSEKDYINPYYVAAKADGKEIENTVLINQPEGYPTMFTNIEADTTEKGFIVWKVPEKWKKLEFTYSGWEGSDGLTLNAVFTPKDLKAPEQY